MHNSGTQRPCYCSTSAKLTWAHQERQELVAHQSRCIEEAAGLQHTELLQSHMANINDVPPERRLQLLVDAVVDYAIFLLDQNGMIASWNSGAQRIKGYRAAEIIGTHFSIFYTPEDREKQLPRTALGTAAEKGKYEAEGWRVRKDGSRFFASVVIDPVRSDTG